MKGGIGQLMKQAQQMQANMKKAQEEMANITVTGESGGGMVGALKLGAVGMRVSTYGIPDRSTPAGTQVIL